MQNDWPHTHMWQLRIWRDISAAEVSHEEQGVQPHTGLPSTEHQCQEEEPPKHLAIKIGRNPFHLGEKEGS